MAMVGRACVIASGTRSNESDVGDRRPRGEEPVVAHPLQDVRERQEAERHVIAAHEDRISRRRDVRVDVVVRQHHALGSPVVPDV
jgi:hypothetical protein